MALNIVGTFPILTFRKSQTDEYGFDYLSFQYTIKTSDLAIYNIKKDDVFTGIESWNGGISFAASPNSAPPYVVDTVETNNVAGGLTELMVNTVGTKNSAEASAPRITLLAGGPLIFGLSGTPPVSTNTSFFISGYGASGAGQSVEVKFLAKGGAIGQQEIFTTHFSSLMPVTFRGTSLPVPARQPGGFSNVKYAENGSPNGGTFGTYHGFICKTILTEKRGSLLMVTLVYSEAGSAFAFNSLGQATSLYDFPRTG
jgi:hypothetical protein